MGKKIAIIAAAVLTVLLGLLIWKLDIPHWETLNTDKIRAQPKASVVYDSKGDAVGALSSVQRRIWAPLEEIPETLQHAFLAAEDHRFYEHNGISLRRIFGAKGKHSFRRPVRKDFRGELL